MSAKERSGEEGHKNSTEAHAYTENEVKAHLYDGTEWVPTASILGTQGEIDCVDDRGKKKIVGAPAGDIGVVVQMASGIEHTLGRALSKNELLQLYRAYRNTFDVLSMHTGEHGVMEFQKMISANSPTARRMFERNPDAKQSALIARDLLVGPDFVGRKFNLTADDIALLKSDILDLVTNPDFHDCGDYKNHMLSPSDYQVRPQLMRDLAQIHFEKTWIGKGSTTLVLDGHHAARGVCSVVMNDEESKNLWQQVYQVAQGARTFYSLNNLIPAVAPSVSNGEVRQMFVDHPEIVDMVRTLACATILPQLDFVPSNSHIAIQREVQRLAVLRKNQTLARLAKKQPVFRAVGDSRQQSFDVAFQGYIKGVDGGGQLVLARTLEECDEQTLRRL